MTNKWVCHQQTANAMACGLLRPPLTFSSHSQPTLFNLSLTSTKNSSIHLNRPFLHPCLSFHTRFHPCSAASPGGLPPRDEDLVLSSGLDAKFLRLKDTVQIFFAVLFWMSLFFWACVWDDKSDGYPTKGSRFKR